MRDRVFRVLRQRTAKWGRGAIGAIGPIGAIGANAAMRMLTTSRNIVMGISIWIVDWSRQGPKEVEIVILGVGAIRFIAAVVLF
jgi:hypothetical protein